MESKEILTDAELGKLRKLHAALQAKLIELLERVQTECPECTLQEVQLRILHAIQDTPACNPALMLLRQCSPGELRQLAHVMYGETEQTHLVPFLTDEEVIALALSGTNPAAVARERYMAAYHERSEKRAQIQAVIDAQREAATTEDELRAHARATTLGIARERERDRSLSKHLGWI